MLFGPFEKFPVFELKVHGLLSQVYGQKNHDRNELNDLIKKLKKYDFFGPGKDSV